MTIIFLFTIIIYKNSKKKKVGVISLEHSQNIGNNLLKYAISIILSKLGFSPYIVGMRYLNHNISFIRKHTKLRLIYTNFSEIQKDDYDILMVNSDQTWRKWSNEYKFFYDIAFLKFAENWDKPKFVYGASLGRNVWEYSKQDEEIAKSLLKNFTGISVREKSAIILIKEHLDINAALVLDPTLLIDKKYYLNLIQNYKGDISKNDNYIFIYTVTNLESVNLFIKQIKEQYNYKIYWVKENVERFIYGIYNCKSIITDSFHGTIFAIIFNKPFISFTFEYTGKDRFNCLNEIFGFGIGNRFFDINSYPDITLLEKPLYLNKTLLNSLKRESINYLKKNLNNKKSYF